MTVQIAKPVLCALSRWRLRKAKGQRERKKDIYSYMKWRRKELQQQLENHFPAESIQGKDVLDFGCGEGMLTSILLEYDVNRVLGVDLDGEKILIAKRNINDDRASFHISSCHDKIDFVENSFDIVFCFDVLEHVMELKAVVAEWYRILRPKGEVWVWWSPWRNPYGHHLLTLVPLPWVHIIFSEQTLIDVAAEVYDSDDFSPRIWDLDPESGAKMPNRWKTGKNLSSWLNKLTLCELKKTANANDMDIHVTGYPIGHGYGIRNWKSRIVGSIGYLPLIGEFFMGYYIVVFEEVKSEILGLGRLIGNNW